MSEPSPSWAAELLAVRSGDRATTVIPATFRAAGVGAFYVPVVSDFRIDGPWAFAGLPPLARAELRRRRRTLIQRASGRVLDLGGVDVSLRPYAGRDDISSVTVVSPLRSERIRLLRQAREVGVDLHLALSVPAGGRFDAVVSVARLVTATDPDLLARRLLGLVGGDGRLQAVEPAAAVGLARRVQRAGAPLSRGVLGVDVALDVPELLRRNGWFLSDLHKSTVSLTAAPLRTVVDLTARRGPA
ncbi:MAG: hypothetical protein ACKOYM_04100 [Actinomycetes bacterium]